MIHYHQPSGDVELASRHYRKKRETRSPMSIFFIFFSCFLKLGYLPWNRHEICRNASFGVWRKKKKNSRNVPSLKFICYPQQKAFYRPNKRARVTDAASSESQFTRPVHRKCTPIQSSTMLKDTTPRHRTLPQLQKFVGNARMLARDK